MHATKIMVYSHDAFGLGNLRRMLAICEHLLRRWPKLSILLVSGSPMIHEFRLPPGLDYIKLPCLNRGTTGELAAKYLGTSLEETVALRSQLIHSAAIHFKPDLLLVDKKPTGLKGELTATLDYLQKDLPNSKRVLLLRDILDTPQKTIDEWCRYGYYRAIRAYYDQVLVVGMQSVFDLVQEYRLPLSIAHRVRYCGYIRKRPDQLRRINVRSQLGIKRTERLVLVTPGGGEDGYSLVHSYLQGLREIRPSLNEKETFRSLILYGPEMPSEQFLRLQQLAASCPGVIFQSFTNDFLSYVKAADAVVSMGGYNTLTEAIALGKRTVVVPRISPSAEQLIRATRFAQKDWVKMIHPERLTGRSLIQAVLSQLSNPSPPPDDVDFDGLNQAAQYLEALISVPQHIASPMCLLA